MERVCSYCRYGSNNNKKDSIRGANPRRFACVLRRRRCGEGRGWKGYSSPAPPPLGKKNNPKEIGQNLLVEDWAELKLELIQFQMAQKSMLRVVVCVRALRASQTKNETCALCASLCLSGWVSVFSENGGEWLDFFVWRFSAEIEKEKKLQSDAQPYYMGVEQDIELVSPRCKLPMKIKCCYYFRVGSRECHMACLPRPRRRR